MGYVFISYSHSDQEYVQRLVQHLLGQSVESWFDYRLVPGDSFGSRIQAAIDDCDAFLVVLTPDAVASEWVRREIVYADSKKKPVLPLLLLDCEKPIELITLQHEDVRGGRMTTTAFVDRLHTITAGSAVTRLVPTTPVASLAPSQEARRPVRTPKPRGEIKLPAPPRTRIFCVPNQRAGVGKTTSVVNIAAALALHGNEVLVIDFDPQGNASAALDVPHDRSVSDMYNCLVADRPLSQVVQTVADIPNLRCVPATVDLARAETELVSYVARESRLAHALEQLHGKYNDDRYDYIFIDCPPSLGLLTVNALVAAQEVLIPLQCDVHALESLQQLTDSIRLVKRHLNPGLDVSAVLLTMHGRSTRAPDAVEHEVRAYFGARILASVIPRDASISEASTNGQSVMTYDPDSPGAASYFAAALEIATRGARVETK